MLLKKDLIWPWHLTYKHHSSSLHILWSKPPCGWFHEIWARLEQRERWWTPEKDFSYKSALTFTVDFENWFKVTTHPLIKISVYVDYEPNRASEKSKKRIFAWSDVTLTLYLQTSFKVTAHSLTINTLWVKYESDWTKWREDMPQTRILYIILI